MKGQIYIDSSENRTDSKTGKALRLGKIEFQDLPWIEKETGADMIISAFDDMPLAPATVRFHLESGKCVLVQIKWGADLLSSINQRMSESISRMIKVAPKTYQRILLPVGYYFRSPADGKILVGERKQTAENPFILWQKSYPAHNWKAYQTAMRRWTLRGGVIIPTVKDETDFIQWIDGMSVDLAELHQLADSYPVQARLYDDGESLASSYDPESDPFQIIKPVDDARTMIASIPGFGPTMVNRLSAGIAKKFGRPDGIATGAEMIEFISKLSSMRWKIAGLGDKRLDNAKAWLGLEENEVMFITAMSDYGEDAMKELKEKLGEKP